MVSNYKKWSTLLGGVIIHLSLGTYYTFGNFAPYLASYLREMAGSNVRYSTSNWILTGYSIALSVSSITTGLICSKYRPNLVIVIFIGCMITTLGTALTYFTVKESYLLTLLTYGCMNGFGVGISYLTPLEVAMRWFPESKGFANSAILFGYGAGGILFNQLETRYINPDNYLPDKPYSKDYPDEKYFSKSHMDLLERVPTVFLLLSGIFLAMQIIGCLLMFENKETTSNKNVASINDTNNDESTNESQPLVSRNNQHKMNSLGVNYGDPNEGLSIAQLLKIPVFYIFAMMYLNSGQAASNVITYFKDFGQTFIKDDVFFSTVASLSCLFNACGRLFWGGLVDKFPYKMCYLTLIATVLSLVSTFYCNKFIQIKWIYLVWVCAINFVQSGIYVITPTAVAKSFGQKYFTSIYGILIFINLPIGIITTFLNLTIDYVGWFWFFMIGCGLTLIGYLSAFFFNVKKEDGNDI